MCTALETVFGPESMVDKFLKRERWRNSLMTEEKDVSVVLCLELSCWVGIVKDCDSFKHLFPVVVSGPRN